MKINENWKVTLTIGQLKRLIKEASEEKLSPELAKLEEILPINALKVAMGGSKRVPNMPKFYNVYKEGDSFILWTDHRHAYRLTINDNGAELTRMADEKSPIDQDKVIWSLPGITSIEQLYRNISFAKTIINITKTRL